MLAFAKASGVQPRDESVWGTYAAEDRFAQCTFGETLQRDDVLKRVYEYIREPGTRTGVEASKSRECTINVGGVLSAPGGGKSHFLDAVSEKTKEDVGLPDNTELLMLKITFNACMRRVATESKHEVCSLL